MALLNGPDTKEPFFKQNGWCSEVVPDFLTWLSDNCKYAYVLN